MFRLSNISKTFYNEKTKEKTFSIDSIDLDFAKSGLVTIIGKSGSGKTTLLNIMSTLDDPDNGKIIIDNNIVGKDIDVDTYRSKCVSFIFQKNNLIHNLNVYKNVAMPLAVNGISIDNNLVNSAIEQVGITDLAKKKVKNLSGGQEQRVAIARALVKDTPIIFADEPTANLDEKNADTVFKLLKDLSINKLVIIVSHDESRCYNYADRIIKLEDGNIVKDITRSEKMSDHIVLIPSSGEISKKTIEQLNAKGEKRIVLGEQEIFFNTKNDTKVNIDEVKKKYYKSNGLKLNQLLSLTLSSMTMSKLKTCLIIFISSILLALVGLSATIVNYDKNVGMALSYLNSPQDSLVLIKGKVDERGNFLDCIGELSKDNIDYLASNYDNELIAIKNISGFSMQTSYLEERDIIPKGIIGALEINEKKLNELGYKLMDFPYIDINNPEIKSRFPKTGRPVPISEGNHLQVNEAVITDYMAYVLYREIFGINFEKLPNSLNANTSSIKQFLNSGFEKEFLKYNYLYLLPNHIKIVGIIDTGYKDKYLNILEGNYSKTDTLYKEFVVDVMSIHSLVYTGEGFAETCYTNNFEGNFHYITRSNSIYNDYQREGLINYIDGYTEEKLNENDIILDIQVFEKYVDEKFDVSRRTPYKLKNSYDNIDFSNLNVVGVVDTRGKQKFKRAGIICSEKLISELGKNNDYDIGARLTFDDTDVKELFKYISKNQITPIISNLATVLTVTNLLDNLSSIFVPILISITALSFIVISIFVSNSILSKKYSNGLYRSFGMNKKDSIKYLISECIVYAFIITITACVLLILFTNIANVILYDAVGQYNPLYLLGIELFYYDWISYFALILGISIMICVFMIYPLVIMSKISPIDSIRRAD